VGALGGGEKLAERHGVVLIEAILSNPVPDLTSGTCAIDSDTVLKDIWELSELSRG
jgi:hypothetical protein